MRKITPATNSPFLSSAPECSFAVNSIDSDADEVPRPGCGTFEMDVEISLTTTVAKGVCRRTRNCVGPFTFLPLDKQLSGLTNELTPVGEAVGLGQIAQHYNSLVDDRAGYELARPPRSGGAGAR